MSISTPDWSSGTSSTYSSDSYYWYDLNQPEVVKFYYSTDYNNYDEKIKKLEERIDFLVDVIVSLVTGMNRSSMKIHGYKEALDICIEKLSEEIEKKSKEKKGKKKSKDELFTDEEFFI